MSNEYPDILGDLVMAQQRFEANGVHYVMALKPGEVAPGEATELHAWLQNCWDVPIQVSVTVRLPVQRIPTFSVVQASTDVPLEAAEAGELTIPIAVGPQTEPGPHVVGMAISATAATRGLYVRSQKSQGQLGESLLSFKTGMGLSATLGLGFVARSQPEQQMPVQVQGAPLQVSPPDLTPTYLSHWTVADLMFEGKARRHVNDQRIDILPRLNRQAVYMAFLEESQARLRDAGLPLHIGEALFLAKILTFGVEYLLQNPDWQDGLLIPAYELAYRYNLATGDPVFLLARADYARLARLAISLSFGLLSQRLKREPWTMEEQLAVADLVADRVERGGQLPAEFLYLPLLLGGLLVAGQVQMPGEKLPQSLALLAQARQKRTAELAENPELGALLDQLLRQAGSGT